MIRLAHGRMQSSDLIFHHMIFDLLMISYVVIILPVLVALVRATFLIYR
jgi:hypothetical protein